MKLSNKGFTLIELLAVIAMISLVSSISIYFASDVIRKSREKSYEVTVRNIESKASNYLVENGNRLFYLSNGSNKEYQCITVKNLVDYGYLSNDVTKSKVSDNQNVKLDDYIYVERDEKNKTVEKSNYIYVSDYIYDSICSKAVKATGDVSFAVEPDINEWSKYKDITITYKLKKTSYSLYDME